MRPTFFLKCLKLNVDFGNAVKISEKIFNFLDTFIYRLYRENFFSLGVSVVTNGFKISDITKKNFFQLKFFQSAEQSW